MDDLLRDDIRMVGNQIEPFVTQIPGTVKSWERIKARLAPPLSGGSVDQRIKIDQTEFGERGNCQSACLAMILGIPIEQVPNFFDGIDLKDPDLTEKWCEAQRKWLHGLGWASITVDARGYGFDKHFSAGFVIASGLSQRGLMHSVVYKDGKLWHDPHPSHDGIEKVIDAEVLYPLNPSLRLPSYPVGPTDKKEGEA